MQGNEILTPSEDMAQGPELKSQDLSQPSSNRILIAEDNTVNQRVALRQVEKLGYRRDVVANGIEVLEALSRISYALVLMDYMMPELDGYETTMRIRQLTGPVRHTPIIAMTGNAMKGERERCLQFGMDDYITKPVKTDELAVAIERWIAQTDSPQIKSQMKENSMTYNMDQYRSEITERLAIIREEFGQDFVVELIDEYLPDAEKRVKALQAALEASDWQNLSREAHGLKGGSRNMGALSLASLCEKLEKEGREAAVSDADKKVKEIEEIFRRLSPIFQDEKSFAEC